jgi:hypothetical protein
MFTPSDERVFELEMWVKGISAFFQIENLPLSIYEKDHASLYNFRSEVACVRVVLGKIMTLLNDMLGPDRAHFGQFLLYMQSVQSDQELTSEGLHGDLLTATEHIQDLERILGEMQNISFVSLQTYLASGRIIQSFLKDYLALNRIFKAEAKPSWGGIQKEHIKDHLRILKRHPVGKDLLTLLIAHIKALRYLEIIHTTIDDKNSYPAAVVLFSLVHNHLGKIGGFLQQRLIPKFKSEPVYATCLDSLLFSSKMEMRKVMEMELVDVTVLLDPKIIRIKLEDSIGILRDLFQQNLVYILETFSLKEVDGSRLFPSYQARRDQSQILFNDLKELDERLQAFRDKGSRADYQKFYETLMAFQNKSMRFLMYKDWGPVERFLQDFRNSTTMKQREILAHQFGIFVKTLLNLVQKRAVLQK